jgi:hypothetical protein
MCAYIPTRTLEQIRYRIDHFISRWSDEEASQFKAYIEKYRDLPTKDKLRRITKRLPYKSEDQVHLYHFEVSGVFWSNIFTNYIELQQEAEVR